MHCGELCETVTTHWSDFAKIQTILCYIYEHHTSRIAIFSAFSSKRQDLVPDRRLFKRQVKQLKYKIHHGGDLNLELYSPYVLVAVVKNFLRHLPDCLMRSILYQNWMAFPRMNSYIQKVSGIRRLITTIVAEHYTLLERIMLLMNKVKEKWRYNRMASISLAKNMSGFLIWKHSDDRPCHSDEIVGCDTAMNLICFMINEAKMIFQVKSRDVVFGIIAAPAAEMPIAKSPNILKKFVDADKISISLSQKSSQTSIPSQQPCIQISSKPINSKCSSSPGKMAKDDCSNTCDNMNHDAIISNNQLKDEQLKNDYCKCKKFCKVSFEHHHMFRFAAEQNSTIEPALEDSLEDGCDNIETAMLRHKFSCKPISRNSQRIGTFRRSKSERIISKQMKFYPMRSKSINSKKTASSELNISNNSAKTNLCDSYTSHNSLKSSQAKVANNILKEKKRFCISMEEINDLRKRSDLRPVKERNLYTCGQSVNNKSSESKYYDSHNIIIMNKSNEECECKTCLGCNQSSGFDKSSSQIDISTDLDANFTFDSDISSKSMSIIDSLVSPFYKKSVESLQNNQIAGDCIITTLGNYKQDSILKCQLRKDAIPKEVYKSQLHFSGPNKPEETDL